MDKKHIKTVLELESIRSSKHYKPGWTFFECQKRGVDETLNELISEGMLVALLPAEERKILTIELVPKLAQYKNVRSNISEEEWNVIREATYKKANYCCEICGGIGKDKHRVECHEIWKYKDNEQIQQLEGFISLCPSCHEVKHMGYANTQGRGDIAKEHLAFINDWTPSKTNKYVNEQFKLYDQRSKYPWKLDISFIQTDENEQHGVMPNGVKFKVIRKLH